ncbi:transcriptional regulator family: Fungal Specific TF [Penicillium roqueforti]|nr:transcriptional regulator family: Fungal Specific TF [Penicillium roqueforti]KAI3092021.1 transcriptional regulator family: Fungal Specific TF [Penicillium roqueforti]KAI3184954.1 transcriptional regulator family: Fungal Specific TF [Penicillium roqueforti]
MEYSVSAPVLNGRLYKSRKCRPCDACRKRKVACDMPHGPPCHRCTNRDQECTFEEGPGPRKRARLYEQLETFETCEQPDGWLHLLTETRPNDGKDVEGFTPEETRQAESISPQRSDSPVSRYGTAGVGSRGSISSSPEMSPPSRERPAFRDSPSQVDSLEFIPGAFSFYIGPTGVSDIHILSHQAYDGQNVSLPKVNGLKYRIMDNAHQKEGKPFELSHPTVFGITDHSLLEKAEPKLDPQLTDNAWPRLWAMMDPTAAWHLIKLYSRYVDPYFPILSSHQIPSSPGELVRMPLALLTAICATALPFVMYDDSLYTLLLNPPSSEQLYRLCWLCLSQELHAPSLATLQACLLLQQRLPTNMYLSDTAFTWTLSSTSLAVAQTIGLHRDPESWMSIPPWEKRLRRRLWWGLYIMEKWVALARGMPSHLGDDDYDVSLLQQEDIQDTLSDSPDTKSHMYHLSTLTTILWDIQRSFYSVKAIGKTSNDLQYSLDLARPMRVKLKDWRENLPSNLKSTSNAANSGGDLDGNGSLYLSYIVTHVALLRALLRPLDRWPTIIQRNKEEPDATYEGAKAVVKGALLCVKEFVEFVEKLTGAQWNSFWHSWSRPNFAIAGSFMVHLLQIVTPSNRAEIPATFELAKYSFEKEYAELQSWIRRWRWATRISANGAAGVKGLTNLGFIKVETLMGNVT